VKIFHYFITLFLILLASAPAPLSAGESAEPRGRDIIIAVDASVSMSSADKEQKREHAIQTVLTSLAAGSGDRIAVIQFAAWNETLEKGVFLFPAQGGAGFPIASVPGEGAERDAFLQKLDETLSARGASIGRGSDLNVAFEKGIFPIMEARKNSNSQNKLQIELIADGYYEVVEKTVRPEYVELAKKSGRVDRESLNKAAFQYFKDVVVPRFNELKDAAVNITNPQPERPPEDPLAVISGAFPPPDPAALIRNADEPSKRSEVGVDAMKSVEFPAHVYQGGVKTKIVIIPKPQNRDYTIDLLDSGKSSVLASEGVKILGAKQANRIFLLTSVPWGDYTVKITNNRNASITFEISVLYSEFALDVAIAPPDPANLPVPGGDANVVVKVSESGKTEPLADPLFIKDLAGTVALIYPDGATKTSEIPPTGLKEAAVTVKFPIPASASGKCTVTAELKSVKDTVKPIYSWTGSAGPVDFTTKTLVEVSFKSDSDVINKEIELAANIKGAVDVDKIEAELKSSSGETIKVELKKSGALYAGKTTFLKPGKYEVVRKDFPAFIVVPGKTAVFTANEPPFDLGKFIDENKTVLLIIAGVIALIILAIIIYIATRPKFKQHQLVRLDSISRAPGAQINRAYLREFQKKKRYAEGPPGYGGAVAFNLLKMRSCAASPLSDVFQIACEDGALAGGRILSNAEKFSVAKPGEPAVFFVFFYHEPTREELLKAAGIFGEPLADDEFILEDDGFVVSGKPASAFGAKLVAGGQSATKALIVQPKTPPASASQAARAVDDAIRSAAEAPTPDPLFGLPTAEMPAPYEKAADLDPEITQEIRPEDISSDDEPDASAEAAADGEKTGGDKKSEEPSEEDIFGK
jgi:hypothetical protein